MDTQSYFYHYLFIGIFVLVAIVFPILPIILAKFVAPKKPSPIKNATYECGLEAQGDPWIQFRIQYYLYALIFVIFDGKFWGRVLTFDKVSPSPGSDHPLRYNFPIPAFVGADTAEQAVGFKFC